MFLIHSATINMSRVSDDGSESIDIDYTTQQQLRAMNVTTDGNYSDIVTILYSRKLSREKAFANL